MLSPPIMFKESSPVELVTVLLEMTELTVQEIVVAVISEADGIYPR